ncbi:hypothetical protein D9B95_01710, partial [Corynebacterium diphtheriae]
SHKPDGSGLSRTIHKLPIKHLPESPTHKQLDRLFFRKICDVIAATSADYEEIKSYKEVKNFFAGIQNRLHFATHGNTAAELICLRADHTKPNAGLTNWTGEQPHKGDMSIAKNFLNYAEDQAERKRLSC